MRKETIRPILVLLVLLLIPSAAILAGAEGVQFAGDFYKVEGGPKIDVSVVNPVFAPGTSGTLRLVLANDGVVTRLVPGDVPLGSEEEATREMLAEFGCLDASNLRATLSSTGPVQVLSGPVPIDLLGPGETTTIEYDIEIDDGAEGPLLLSLDVEYEHQIDVSFNGGTASPLYLPSSLQLDLIVSVEGEPATLALLGSRSDLAPGEKGSVSLIVGNAGKAAASNCTARLVTAPPFTPLRDRSNLGDIPPRGVAVARFDLLVEGSAPAQEYSIGCEISFDGGEASLSVPVTVTSPDRTRLFKIALAGITVLTAAVATIWLLRRRKNRSLRSRSPLRPRR